MKIFVMSLCFSLALQLTAANLTTSKSSYVPNEDIVVNFTGGPGNAKDWIGLYTTAQGVPGSGNTSIKWSYVTNSETDGSVTFAGGLPNEGAYTAYFCENDGYTVLGSVEFSVAIPVQNAVNFDQATAQDIYINGVSLTDIAGAGASATKSISLWVKPNAAAPTANNSYGGAGIVGDKGGYWGIYQANVGGEDKIWAYNWDTNEDKVGVEYTANTWMHIAYVHDGTNLKIFKNGAEVASVPSGTTGGGGDFNLGKAYGKNFTGEIDELLVWDVTLTESQIQELLSKECSEADINAISGLTWANLKAYYVFNETTGTNVPDVSGSAVKHNLTFYNMNDTNWVVSELPYDSVLTPVVGLSYEVKAVDGQNVITWLAENEGTVKEYIVKKLVDGSWQEIAKVAKGENYSVVDSSEGAGKYMLVVVDHGGETQSFDINDSEAVVVDLKKGWNLVSLPFDTLNPVEEMELSDSVIWIWDNAEKGYVKSETLLANQGAWVWSGEEKAVTVKGLIENNQVEVFNGWNLVGPSENVLVPEDVTVYSWLGAYELLSEQKYMQVGKAYWLFSQGNKIFEF